MADTEIDTDEVDIDLSAFNPKQIEMGKEDEAVHGFDEEDTLKIITDHLKECPEYYTRLRVMEKGFGKKLGL